MRKKLLIRSIIFFAVITTFTFTLRGLFNVNLDQIEKIVVSFGIFAPAIYSLILFLGLAIPFNPISDFLTVNIAALLFAPLEAVIATFIAHSLALCTNYFLAANFGNAILKKITSKKEAKYIERFTKKLTLREIFGLRFVLPVTQALGVDIISYAAGLEKISFPKFFLASIIPWTMLSVTYFYATSYFKTQSLFLYFVPAGVLILIPALVLFLKRQS